MRDNSGLRIHLTPTLREHDIGIMTLGVVVDSALMVPPHYDGLVYRGYCTQDCMREVNIYVKRGCGLCFVCVCVL